MNHVFRSIWSEALGAWVAVSELVSAQGKRSRSLCRSVALSQGLLLVAGTAHADLALDALPTQGQVASGQASIQQQGAHLQVNQQSDKAIINWQSFNIGKDAQLDFQQPDSQAIALNRVAQSEPSQILGKLSANGQIFLLNPNGVIFGAGAQVDVGGMVASTGRLADANFNNGNYQFERHGADGEILNRGQITSKAGGYIALLADTVRNLGTVRSDSGTVLLAAGESVKLTLNNGQLVSWQIDPATVKTLIANQQLIQAADGRVILSAEAADQLQAAVVNNTGVIEATSLHHQGGVIQISADTVRNSGTLDASGERGGGSIELSASAQNPSDTTPTLQQSGVLKANATAGQGGQIQLIGTRIALADNSQSDASGATGGGVIQIGGGQHGAQLTSQFPSPTGQTLKANADDVSLAAGASIKASATDRGEGGKIVVWSEKTTTIAATLRAEGGAQGGNGGFIETSGHTLAIANSTKVSTSATQGHNGQWLLDPYNFSIAASGGDMTGSSLSQALNSNSVTIQTSNADVSCSNASCSTGQLGQGDILVNDTISWSADNTLTLNAWRNIDINQSITASGAQGKLALLYGQGAVASANTASYTVKAPVYLQAGANFSTTLGSDGTTIAYTVITSLGDEGSTTGSDLQGISADLLGNYVLGANIDASATNNWNPDGSGAYYGFAPIGTVINSFNGRLDGLGHTINSLFINRPLDEFVGLFVNIGGAGRVQNLGIVGGSVHGLSKVGGIAGMNDGGVIRNVYVNSAVSGNSSVGGLVGVNNGRVINTYATGTVIVSENVAGGLLGINNGTLTQSYAGNTVNGNSGIGGLVGVNMDNGLITNTFATGTVTASGVNAGGLIAINFGTLTQSYAVNTVSANDTAGGLVGINADTGVITNTYATGSVTGNTSNVGGLVGINYGQISYVHSTNSQVKSDSGENVGGLVGLNGYGGSISDAYADSPVNGSKGVGGLVGQNQSSVNYAYATGAVSGSTFLGGLVGTNAGGDISNAYSLSAVRGSSKLGGLAGSNSGNIINSYAAGVVVGETTDHVGGLLGFAEGGSSISNSFWDTDISQQTSSAGGTGLSTAQMHAQSHFPSWDFKDTWVIYEGYTNPLLRSFMTLLTVTANDASKTYDGQRYDGSADVSYSLTPNSSLFGTLTYSSGINAGAQPIVLSGLYSNQQGYLIQYVDGTLAIAKASYTAVSGTKTYDGNANFASGTLTGVNGEQFTVSDLVADSANASANNGASKFIDYTGSITGLNGADSGNYNLTLSSLTGSNNVATITKADLKVIGANTVTTYNGGVQTNTFTLEGIKGSDTVTSVVGLASQTHYSASAYQDELSDAQGTGLSNYTISYQNGSLTIGKASYTAVNGTKTYDGNANFASGTLTGVNGEQFTVSDLVADSANASANNGASKFIAYTGGITGLNGADSGNYNLTLSSLTGSDNVATINKASLTVTGANHAVTYNGLVQTNQPATLTGQQGGDSFTVSGYASGTNANTYMDDLRVSGSAVNNYDVAYSNGSLTINKANAIVTADSKTVIYNGQTQTVSGFTASGLVNGETTSVLTGVSTAGGSGKNAGSYTLIASGSDPNYTLRFVEGALTINKANAIVTADSKTVIYNGQTQTVSGFSASGLVNGETASVLTGVTTTGGSGKNVGSYTVTASGSDPNYNLRFVDGALTINKASLTVTGANNTVTYNGLVQTNHPAILTGQQGSDSFTVSGYASGSNAGQYTDSLSVSGSALDNYEVSYANGTLNVQKALATISAAQSRTVTYNGKTQTYTVGSTVSGLVNGETVGNALSGVTIGKTISAKNAGFYGVSVSGSAQNYDFNLVGGLTIKKANATITATSKTLTYNGFNQSVSGFTVKGLVGGEKASVLSDVSAGVSGKDVGRYVAVASGTDDNYNLSFVNGTLTITQASAKVIANSKTVSYTGALQTVSGFTVQGLVGNDTASVLTGVSTTGGSGIKVGKYSLIASGSDKNYKLTFVKGALTIKR